MSRTVNCTLGQLGGLIDRDIKRFSKNVDKAIAKTAHDGVRVVRSRVPVAFGELSESVQDYSKGETGNHVISVDAPHAGAVEIGSPPHKPDYEKLLAWVELKFGLSGQAAERVTDRISRAIERRGTPPHWYVRESLPEILKLLDENIQKAKQSTSSGGSSGSGRAARGAGSRGGDPDAATKRLKLYGKNAEEVAAAHAQERSRNANQARKNFAGKRVNNRWGHGPKDGE